MSKLRYDFTGWISMLQLVYCTEKVRTRKKGKEHLRVLNALRFCIHIKLDRASHSNIAVLICRVFCHQPFPLLLLSMAPDTYSSACGRIYHY